MLHKKSKEIEEKKNIKGYSLKKGRNIIKLHRLQKNFYEFEKFQLINQKDIKLAGLFGDKFHSFVKKYQILIVTENRARDRSHNSFMKKCGLRIKYTNQLFTKNLRNFKSNYKDTFEYRSLSELGLLKFFRIYKISVEDPIKQYEQFRKYINKMRMHIRNTYDYNNWKIVSLNNNNIGIIMPHIFPGNPKQGTLYDIGLIPEHRGKGYGRIMHARGMELLKQMGAGRYLGSTKTTNFAMLRLFEINGCKKTFKRHFFYAK